MDNEYTMNRSCDTDWLYEIKHGVNTLVMLQADVAMAVVTFLKLLC
jgi:hypothetical protein